MSRFSEPRLPGQPLMMWGRPIKDWYRAAFGLLGVAMVAVVMAEAFWFLVIVNALNWLSSTHI